MRAVLKVGLKAYSLAVLFVVSISSANATLITGADLLTNPNVSIPGSTTVNGNSLRFSGGSNLQALFTIDLSNYGFGVGANQVDNGSIELLNTRLTSDSDIWFGLWDGNVLETFTSWDGNRSNVFTNGSYVSGANTYSLGSGSTTINYSATQNVGQQLNLIFDFNLSTGVIEHSITSLGFFRSQQMSNAFDASNGLYFFVGKGSIGETIQVDSVTINGGSVASVSAPTTIVLFASSLLLLAARRRKTNL